MSSRVFKLGHTDRDRLEAFSDGVLAIVITLLVLEVKAPTPATTHADRLWAAILEALPAIGAAVGGLPAAVAAVDVAHGRSSNASRWLGRTTPKCRRSRVATSRTARRSPAATTDASTEPRGRSA